MAVFVEPQPELLHYGIFRLAVLAIYGFDAEHALHLYSFGCGDYGEIASVGELPALRVLYLDSCSAVGALGLALGGGGRVPLVTSVEARCHALCVAYGEVVQGVTEAPLLLRFGDWRQPFIDGCHLVLESCVRSHRSKSDWVWVSCFADCFGLL